jgi:hypothetical protein
MYKRLPLPGSIPTGNAYNILLHVEHGPRDEIDRGVQIAREGLAAARQVRSDLLSLQGGVPADAQLLVDVICGKVASRAIFAPSFREAVTRLQFDIQSWGMQEQDVTRILLRLEQTLEASEKVADVLAAVNAVADVIRDRNSA